MEWVYCCLRHTKQIIYLLQLRVIVTYFCLVYRLQTFMTNRIPCITLSVVKRCPATPCRRQGDRRYSSHSLLTSALDGGEWSASRPGRALPPGKGPPVPTGQEAGWASEPVWTQRQEEKSSRLCRGSNLNHPVVQPVTSNYTDWATGLQKYINKPK
jgi:hypothetical protein